MKKLLLIAGVFAVFSTQAFAGTADLFDLNEEAIVAEFAELTELENFVADNEGFTLSMLNEDNALTANLSFDANNVLSSLSMFEPPLGIPSFIWGFCLGWVGILVTYLVTDDKEETKKALIGCIVGALAGVIIYFVVIVLILGAGFAAA